ncbi:MAG: class I SAM-dependent methyltransferase [bacterium]
MKTVKDVLSLVRLMGIKEFVNLIRSLKQNTVYFRGFFVSSCIGTLLKTPFFEELSINGKIDLGNFCKTNNYDIYFLRTICNYLVSVGLLDIEGDMYKMNKSFRLTYSRGGYQFINAYYSVFENLGNLLNKQKQYGVDVNRDIKHVTAGSAQTEKIIPYPYAKKLIKKHGCKSVLDLGCGNGEFLIYLSDVLPEKSYGVDISNAAIKEAIDNIARHNLSGHIDVFQGDILNLGDKINVKADVLTILYILHELVEAENNISGVIKFLKNLRTSFPGSKLIVLESCKYDIPFLRKTKSYLTEHLLFHLVSKQTLLPFDDWKNIFLKSGYKILEAIELRIVGQGFFVLE